LKSAPPIAAAIAGCEAPFRSRYLERLVEALHRSRRLQAAQIIHDYRFLALDGRK
jgi:hypothetical protein